MTSKPAVPPSERRRAQFMERGPASERNEIGEIRPAFARHETFHPRYGWIKKGFDAVLRDPQIFARDDASVVLGVGKNMVRAIRYWCHATKVLKDDGPRGTGSATTAFGRSLLGRDGFDPYLENLGSLWLLHWRLLTPPCSATAWHFAFNVFAKQEFSVGDLNTELANYVFREFPNARLASSSLKKDTACILRMYASSPIESTVSEDTIQCPFTELGLISHTSSATLSFNIRQKPGLTPSLIAAMALEFAALADSNVRTISLSRLLHAPGSPGAVLKLTEAALYAALEETASTVKAIALSDGGGLIQLSFKEPALDLAARFVRGHYETTIGHRVAQ